MAAVGHQTQIPSQKQKNNAPPVTQLEFHQAMTDFKTMFPEMDEDVIEVVLRANNGAVDATIDQLLSMSTDNENERLRTELDATENDELPPSYSPATPPPSYHQAVPYAHSPGRSLMAPLSRSRKTSGSSPSLMRHMQLLNQRLPASQALPSIARIPPPKKEKEKPEENLNCAPLRYQKKWNPPLVGPLPPSFLRLDDKHQRSKRGKYVTVLSSAVLQKRMQENERQRRNTIGAEDPEMAQYLEDERIALFLQNEEFVRELMGNKEFMSSLEKDASNNGTLTLQSRHNNQTIKGAEKVMDNLNSSKSEERNHLPRSLSGDDSDAAFRERLKNMGKTSRRKFAQLASMFSSRRKRPFKPILGDGSNPSRDNLLLTEDEYAQLSEEDSDTDWNKKDSWNSHYGESQQNSKPEHSKPDNT